MSAVIPCIPIEYLTLESLGHATKTHERRLSHFLSLQMPATVAPAPFVTAQAHIVRVNDGSFYGIDSKDRRSISKWCLTKDSTHPCLVMFDDESVGLVQRLHQDSKTKECDVVVAKG